MRNERQKGVGMVLLLDIGNTHTHLGLGTKSRVVKSGRIPTSEWMGGGAERALRRFVGSDVPGGVMSCSVVPKIMRQVRSTVRALFKLKVRVLDWKRLPGLGINYPRPETIGQDRLANAVAAVHQFRPPVVVVDFGTAVTFDVVDAKGRYSGGIIAPGLAAMTDYLFEKTALLPRITIREPEGVVGKSTEGAMLVGAVFGYRGLIRGLLRELKSELGVRRLPLIATGGYAELMAAGMPEIKRVSPDLTLEGLRLVWGGGG